MTNTLDKILAAQSEGIEVGKMIIEERVEAIIERLIARLESINE